MGGWLVTGGSGYLGRYTTLLARDRGIEVLPTFLRGARRCPPGGLSLDLGDVMLGQVLREFRPEVVVHTAAVNPGTGTDESMWETNAEGSGRLARAALRAGCRRFVHVSTDVVHDGTSGPYSDDAVPTASSAYGQSKAEGEHQVLDALGDTPCLPVVVRTSLIYGLGAMDRGTAGFSSRLERGEKVGLFSDVVRQPIDLQTLADALLFLGTANAFVGRLNIAGGQVLSRADFGRRLLSFWGVEGIEEGVEEVEARSLAPDVPRDLRLELARARGVLPFDLPGVDEVLRDQQVARSTRAQSEQTWRI